MRNMNMPEIIKVRGERTELGCCLWVNDERVKHKVYHSPTGMEWGYSGSGPADTARSILLMLVPKRMADLLYQKFKFDFVAAWPQDTLEFVDEICFRDWAIRNLKELGYNI